MKTMLVFSVVALVTTPAFAAEFYIVQDIEKRTCIVAQEPAKGDKQAPVGEGAYNDEATATSDMKKMLACNPTDGTSGTPPQSPAGLKIQ
jgi:hypothetical protein